MVLLYDLSFILYNTTLVDLLRFSFQQCPAISGLKLWVPFLSHFDLPRKSKNFKPFFAINDKQRIKVIPYKIIKIAIKFSIFYWKNYGRGFFSLFPQNLCHFSKWNVLKTFWDFEKLSIMAKIWQ